MPFLLRCAAPFLDIYQFSFCVTLHSVSWTSTPNFGVSCVYGHYDLKKYAYNLHESFINWWKSLDSEVFVILIY